MMSESGQSTALVPSGGKPYNKPDFAGRQEFMKEKYLKAIQGTKLNIRNHVEKETSKAIYKLRDEINDGDAEVKEQKDFGPINIRIKALNKKNELQKKIKHMGIKEAVLRKDEMEEKLRLLNENVDLIAREQAPAETQSQPEGEGEGGSLANPKNTRNRMSVDALYSLENKLGLPISEKNARVMNYKDKMHMSKEELLKSQKEAEDFVNKMKEREKKLEEEKQRRRDKEAYKTKTFLDKTSAKKKELEEKRKKKVLDRIEEHKQHMEKVQEKRAEREKTWKEFKQKEKVEKPLYKAIEDRYNKDILMPELQKKKKDLDSIRKFHKPIKREDLDEHEKDYQEKIKIEREKQRIKREKWYSDIGYGVYDENRYKTKFYEKAIAEEKKKVEIERVNSSHRKNKTDKMNNYAKIVKEMHWPQVSERKKKEIEELKDKMNYQKKPKFRSPQMRSSRYNSSESPEREKILKKPDWKKFHNPMLPKPETKKEGYEVDWLAERRAKRENGDTKSKLNQSHGWKSIADKDDLDENTKAQLLKSKARMLEENAQRKEQINKVQGATMEGTVEVNEMLIDAIESKLSLLDNYMQS